MRISDGPVGYGLIGPGFIGEEHLRRIQTLEGARVVAVAGRDAGKAAEAAARFGARGAATVEALLADPEVEVVLIATPHTTHAELAIQALRAGKHLLLEKPVSHRLSEARAITAAWHAARAVYPGLHYGVMLQERMQPSWTQLRELLHAGVLGRLMRVTWIDTAWYRTMAYFGSGDWRATWAGEGGGALINQAVHRLDLYGWLFGRPERLHAMGALGKYHQIQTEDEVTMWLEHAGGMVGHFIVSTAEFPGTQRLEIVGEHGRLVCEDGRLIHDRNSESALEFIRTCPTSFGLPTKVRTELEVPTALAEPHAALLKDYTAAVRGGGPLAVSGEQGEAAVELVNAAMLAMDRRQPVALPLDAAEYDAWLAEKVATAIRGSYCSG